MEITKKERIILINQYRILAELNKDEADYYKELITILEYGYEIFYSMIDEWVSDDMPTDDGRLVLNILDLYRAIEDIKRSSKSENLISHNYAYFRGFDGNNETAHMSFARFIIEKQGKYSEQEQYLRRNDNLNSHMPMVEKYHRMLVQAENIESIWEMSVEQALEIINA